MQNFVYVKYNYHIDTNIRTKQNRQQYFHGLNTAQSIPLTLKPVLMVQSQPRIAYQYAAIELTAHPMNPQYYQLFSPHLREDDSLMLFNSHEEAEAYLEKHCNQLNRPRRRHFIILPIRSFGSD